MNDAASIPLHDAYALYLAGKAGEALDACLAELSREANDPGLCSLAADILIAQRRAAEATPLLYRATMLDPDNAIHWQRLGKLLRTTWLAPNDHVRAWLQKAVHHPSIRTSSIVRSIANTLCKDAVLSGVIAEVSATSRPEDITSGSTLDKLGADSLLIALMTAAYIPSRPLELLFTRLRQGLLINIDKLKLSREALGFCSALAAQAYLTDYAWQVTGEEAERVTMITRRLEQQLRSTNSSDDIPLQLAVTGAYSPLHKLEFVRHLAGIRLPAVLAGMIRLHITEPLEELKIRSGIRQLTSIDNQVSLDVRTQYEENPFPRWHHAGLSPYPVSYAGLMESIGGMVPDEPSFSRPEVLIAGCGTGQQSVTAASNYKDANILAIDLSLTSLAYAIRRTRELGIRNIEYLHGDLTELGKLNRKFHVIECTGVLVCVEDPLAAWKTLIDCLLPGGMMYIALYSEAARRAVVMAREQIRSNGYTSSIDDMRRYRQFILDLPDDHPLASLIVANDLYNISELRDFLFHVKEHRFTIPRIQDMLHELGLRFLGFNIDTRVFQQHNPSDADLISLDCWHAFEQSHPDTFIDMYQFWVQKP